MDALQKHTMISVHLKRGAEVQPCSLERGETPRLLICVDQSIPSEKQAQAGNQFTPTTLSHYYSVIIIAVNIAIIITIVNNYSAV